MKREPSSSSIRRRAKAIDRHVGARVRERRIMLDLTQEQLAGLTEVTIQQVCKYETGINRIAAGRLYQLAQALDVDIGYFFEELGRNSPFNVTREYRLALELARNFVAIPNRSHQQGIISLARALAEPDAGSLALRDSRRRVVWPG